MYRKAKPLFLICETPLHAGSGDSLGIVDLPIQRERHTGFPKIEASSLKGAMREHFENRLVIENSNETDAKFNLKKINLAFGFDEAQVGRFSKAEIKEMFQNDKRDISEFAGCLGFTDARLLLFPVKSMKGVFAWVTCPKIIQKFREELKICGIEPKFEITKGNLISDGNKSLTLKPNKIVLEEFTFTVKGDKEVDNFGQWLALNIFNGEGYQADKLMTDIVVLEDDDFRDFVTLSTEVITRTKINNATGTVEDGALFTEEYLPAESIMYSLVLTAPEFTDIKVAEKTFNNEESLTKFIKDFVNKNQVMQIGGNATLGKGITTIKLIER